MASAPQTTKLYDDVRAAILTLDLVPGAPLSERTLEAQFGASRTPVRAALMRLDGEGLVQRQGRGWIVAPIDLAEIRSLAELREAVESAAVRLAVDRASDEDISALVDLLEATRPTTDEEETVRAGGDFHVELVRLAANPFMLDAVRGAMTRLARTRWLEVRTQASREQAWDEHRAVVAAVAARDGQLAAELVAHHVRDTNDRLLDHLSAHHRRLRGHGVVITGAPAPLG